MRPESRASAGNALSIAAHGNTRQHMAASGGTWRHMAANGNNWPQMQAKGGKFHIATRLAWRFSLTGKEANHFLANNDQH
ncbi:hypothetical protein [Paucidesulfovibrio longus]|uniref:hypothetical protein n=1 Tax=Paucidesulfovibrio longus TaxID=889 RepID=UPI0012DE769E|nr:hypothetical protein [Paucidesulfovibrio longus]